MKLALMMPHAADGTSIARAAMPFAMLAREHQELKLMRGEQRDGREGWTWDRLVENDVVFIQRAATPAHVSMLRMCKILRIPVWADYDDNLLDLPLTHPHWRMSHEKEFRQSVVNCLRLATHITVSTPALAEALKPHTERPITVIPNALNDYSWEMSSVPRKRLVTWRGGASHDEDVSTVLPQLVQLAKGKACAGFTWWFMGDPPTFARAAMPQGCWLEGPSWQLGEMDYFHWQSLFLNCGTFAHIAPLASNAFNESKSNLAWLEATSAGAVVIAPLMDEWRRPGILTYSTPDEFVSIMETVAQSYRDNQMHPNVAESRRYIQRELLLSRVNKQRWELLRVLLKESRR